MSKAPLPFFPLLLPGLAALVVGCGGYTSEYVPPPDGRPRLVWQDNKVVPMISNAVPGQCSAAVDSLAGGGSGVLVRGRTRGGYYAPSRTVVVVGGPVFVPVPRPILVPPVPGAKVGGLGSLGGGGGGGGGDLGKAAVVVAVLAVAVLPFIALGLAAGRPEPESEVAAAIDHANAHTDLARTEGSPCDELIVAGEVGQ
jgi:hypothetical protein